MNSGPRSSEMDIPTSKTRTMTAVGDPHIEVRNLNAFYGKVQALTNINLEIPKRSLTVIMGPSGCGKSTLLKTFNRFLELTDGTKIIGEVRVDGQDIYAKEVDETEVRKRVGLLAQRPSPLPMSIFDNIAFGPRLLKNKTKPDIAAAVEKALRMAVGIPYRSLKYRTVFFKSSAAFWNVRFPLLSA